MRWMLAWGLFVGLAAAGITDVSIESTHRQAIIHYTAPDNNVCTVDVFIDEAMTLPVKDTDVRLFPGADRDDRMGNVWYGLRRAFVAGQIPLPGWPAYSPQEAPVWMQVTGFSRNATGDTATITTAGNHNLVVNDHVTVAGADDPSFEAADTLVLSVPSAKSFTYANPGAGGASAGSGRAARVNRFSRTLQADTQHWYRITCGTEQSSGTFWTANIPIGSTYGELTAFDWSSAPMKYLYPAIPNTRGYEVIDPVTGLLAKRATLASDCPTCGAKDLPTSFDAGSMIACPQQKTNGGYHCTVESHQMSNRLYWYGDDGSVRYLGQLHYYGGTDWAAGYAGPQASWDTNNPNLFWTTGSNRLLALNYTGNDVAVSPNAYVSWTATNMIPAATGKTLTGLIHDFDPSFPRTTYASCGLASVQGDYLTGVCRSENQDSPGWIWALYLGDRLPLGSCSNCLRVVAAAPIHGNAKTRWCGEHYTDQLPVFNVQPFVVQHLVGGGATGPWEVVLQGNIDSTTNSITVSGEPVCNASSLPTDGSTYLQDAAVGDAFMFETGGEMVKLTGKNGTAWTVQRGYAGSTATSHTAGALLRAVCEPLDITSYDDLFWSYLDDPHGTDTSNAYWRQDTAIYNAHRVERDPWDIVAGWSMRYGSFPANNFDGAATATVTASPPFSGTRAGADGNSYQKHPSYENWNAPETERRDWFLDATPFQIAPTTGESALKAGGASYIFKITQNPAAPRDFKKAPYIGISSDKVLLDISGPGSRLDDSPEDQYKLCAVYQAGECWEGSQPGEIYANLPSLSEAGCSTGEVYAGKNDLCAFHVAAYGQAVVQFGLQDGRGSAANARVLVRGLAGPWRRWGTMTNARALPDGEWMVFPTTIFDDNTSGENTSMLARIPPMPAWDGVDRTDFVPIAVAVPGRAGAKKTVVEFGYDPTFSFRCTQRREECIADTATYDHSNPYKFGETDEYSGVDCTVDCSIQIPAIAGRILYYRWKYRAEDGSLIETGPIVASTVPQIPPTSKVPRQPSPLRQPGPSR
ncbi:MAG: hypothetical protein ACLQGV_21785 [Bryobacteraceae bacterium]